LNDWRIHARARSSVLGDGFGAGATLALRAASHARHGTAILIGLYADVTVGEPGREPVRGRVVAVPPDVPHAASCDGVNLAIVYDPERAAPIAAAARRRGGAFALDGRLVEVARAHRSELTDADVLDGIAREIAARLAVERPRPVDRRVATLVEALRAPDADRRAAIARTRLSRAHLGELFAREVGLPARRYQLWHRLLRGLAELSRSGASVAAHAAGFADLAHFSRTCRRMLGESPTAIRDRLLPA
jgi:AraC-like DNA-binding protein